MQVGRYKRDSKKYQQEVLSRLFDGEVLKAAYSIYPVGGLGVYQWVNPWWANSNSSRRYVSINTIISLEKAGFIRRVVEDGFSIVRLSEVPIVDKARGVGRNPATS